jgi:hypothetical protein
MALEDVLLEDAVSTPERLLGFSSEVFSSPPRETEVIDSFE